MSTIVYGILWILCRVLATFLFRYKVVGTEHVPSTGGVIFAANHASYTDIPLLGCGIRRRLYYLGRSTLFPNPVVRRILRSLGWIPLRPARVDRKALGFAVDLLKQGGAVVIFPEGTRTPNGNLQEGKPGVGLIIAEAQCPVVPVYISGTFDVLPIGAKWVRCRPVCVRIGKPMEFVEESRQYQGKELYQQMTERVMAGIADLSRTGQADQSPLSTKVIRTPEN